MRKVLVIFMVLAFMGGTAALADTLKKGDKEITFRFSYSNLNPDEGEDVKTTDLHGGFGYVIAGGHEVGAALDYTKLEVGSDSTDSSQFGLFYNYNFKAGEIMNPYVGVNVRFLGGDLGDVYDNSLGLEAGIKVYPWANAGFAFGIAWDELSGSNGNGDATNTTLFGGVLIKF